MRRPATRESLSERRIGAVSRLEKASKNGIRKFRNGSGAVLRAKNGDARWPITREHILAEKELKILAPLCERSLARPTAGVRTTTMKRQTFDLILRTSS